MALTINQQPASASLAQSPMIYTVDANDINVIASSSMQYICELNYWTGSLFVSASAPFTTYTLAKYPNQSDVGIFDVSKIINSTLSDKLESNPSNTVWYKGDFYIQYIPEGTTAFVTGSHVESDTRVAIDGYGLFPTAIGASINAGSDFFPIMTDGPATQSTFTSDYGEMGVWASSSIDAGRYATEIAYTSSVGENETFTLSSSPSSSGQIDQFPIGEQQPGFPLTLEAEWFTVQAKDDNGYIGDAIRFEYKCEQKYPNVRIKWKNRYGQWDYFNFDMVSRESFSATKRTYQPQIGSWGGSTLSYNNYDSSIENYISDSSQTLKVNTDWVSEDYNDIFKQLLVSDEIYIVQNNPGNDVSPITISTSNMMFKTGVVDKLIKYTFDFKLGQNYKLIL